MSLFILSSNNERIPFHQPKNTPLLFTSIQKLKKQERIPYKYTAKRTKEDAMKQKQFGPLEIVITRTKMQVHSSSVKKLGAGQSKSIDKISFPENLDDSFQQGLLGNMESTFENTIKTDKLPLSQASQKPQELVEESKRPIREVSITTMPKTPKQKFTQKFKIPETSLLDNISQTYKLTNSFIPETPQCHQRRKGLSCSTVPERLFFSKTPTAKMNNKERQIRLRQVRSYGKTPDFVQVVPETPKLKLKSTDEYYLSLYN